MGWTTSLPKDILVHIRDVNDKLIRLKFVSCSLCHLHHIRNDAFQILEVDLWKRGPNLAEIGTFAVPLLTYVLFKTHIKWVPRTISDKDAVRRLCYI